MEDITLEKLVNDSYSKTSLINSIYKENAVLYSSHTLLNDVIDIHIKRDVNTIGTKNEVLCRATNCSIEGNVGGVAGDKRGINVLVKSENSHIEGDVSAGNVLKDANDSYVEGNVNSGQCVLHKTKNSHIKGNVTSRGSVLYESISSYIKGDVSSEGDILDRVKNCYIEGNIKSGPTVLWKAEGSHVKGNVNSGNCVLTDANDSYIEGDVNSGIDVLLNAKKSHIRGNVTSQGTLLNESDDSYVEGDVNNKRDVLHKAKKSHIKGNVKSNGDILQYACNSFIQGNVESNKFILYDSKNSYIDGNVKSETSLLNSCKNCYVVGEEITAPNLGWDSKGGLVAAKKIDCSEVTGGRLTVLTQSNIKDAVKFNGDWKELSDYLSGELKKENFGELDALRLFKIEKKETNLEGFKSELSKLNKKYASVKSAFEEYEDLKDVLGLDDIWWGSNVSKKNYLTNMEAEIKTKLKDKFSITDKTIELIKNTPQRKDLITELEKESDDHHFEGRVGNFNTFYQVTGKSIDDFIQRYSNHKASDFKRTYKLKLKTAASDQSIGKTNETLYKQGLELIEHIHSNGVGLEMNDDRDVMWYVQAIKNEGARIGKLKQEGKSIKDAIKKRKKMNSALNALKIMKANGLILECGTDIDGVKECLSQLSQHYLGGKHKQMAENISKQLVVKENDLSSNVLHAELWNKDISNIPTYAEFKCCGFLGYGNGSIFGYMASNAIELMRFDIGDKSAMAIMAETVDSKGKKVLVVDSVESSSHMLGREEVANAIAKAIESYARKEGFAEVIYSYAAGNNGPQEFIWALTGHESGSKEGLRLADPLKVYLEAHLRSCVRGKMKKLGG
ncbi:MAG: hypothetical protein PHC66_02850 [Candidatus Nanoarchaeia archaeon]|nr:hypothetical protein [Candidatus Nanoarchaeia archaeon]MDD5239001.1 hypothetical protein [Candidatus Nanoarchaeia archaeon]